VSRRDFRYLETQFIPVQRTGQRRPADSGRFKESLFLDNCFARRISRPCRWTSFPIHHHPLQPQKDAEAALERGYAFCQCNRDLWVGVNMVGREDNDKGYALAVPGRPARKFAPHLSRAVHLSIHAGESGAPGRPDPRHAAARAERIGHGINLLSDPDTYLLCERQDARGNQLVSNVCLQYVPDLTRTRFPETCGPACPCAQHGRPRRLGLELHDEYFTAVTTYNLTWEEIVRIGRNSLEYSFRRAPRSKARLLADYEKAVSPVELKYGADNWRESLGRVTPHVSGYAAVTC